MISSNARYWIWIAGALGFNCDKVNKLYELYTDINEFYTGGMAEWRFCGIFTPGELQKLKNTSIQSADEILLKCQKLGYSVIAIDDDLYPECLRNIYASPAVLYVDGNLPDVDNILSIGIVGTRKASGYGVQNAYKFGYALSRYGACVVSGGALGVDCASHRGVLASDGVTVCVLGCGINTNYLSENREMRKSIAKRGAVISEYPPDSPALPYNFPARNRIIAALSDGVLIIESGKKSGSLITADFALDMGKELFALLGNNSPQNEGSNARIKEGTAVPVTDFMDILSAFSGRYPEDGAFDFDNLNFADIEQVPVKSSTAAKPKAKNKKTETNDNKEEIPAPAKPKKELKLEGVEKQVYEFLTAEPVHIDEISEKLGIPVYGVSSALTKLMIMGVVKAEPGRRFCVSASSD